MSRDAWEWFERNRRQNSGPKEPLYRAQRVASEEAFKQAVGNVFRRLLRRPVLKTSHEREVEVLAEYGYGPEHALTKPRRGRSRCLNCRKPIAEGEHFCGEICERYYPINQIYK
jgi:hypothetical protein